MPFPRWEEQQSAEVVTVLQRVAALALFGYPPVVMGEVMRWHLCIQGGVGTVTEALLAHAREEATSCAIADEALEVAVVEGDGTTSRCSDLAVLIECEAALRLLRDHTTIRELRAALVGESFPSQPLVFDTDFDTPDDESAALLELREHEDRDERGGGGGGFSVVPPGQVDFDLLEEANRSLVQGWDPDGSP